MDPTISQLLVVLNYTGKAWFQNTDYWVVHLLKISWLEHLSDNYSQAYSISVTSKGSSQPESEWSWVIVSAQCWEYFSGYIEEYQKSSRNQNTQHWRLMSCLSYKLQLRTYSLGILEFQNSNFYSSNEIIAKFSTYQQR